MNKRDLNGIADWSDSIRDSTLKRLRRVRSGPENYRPTEDAMSIADIAQHLLHADESVFESQRTKQSGKGLGESGQALIHERAEFDGIIEELETMKKRKRSLISSLDEHAMNERITCDRIRGIVEMRFIDLLHENLYHEMYHTGQLSVYLKLMGC